MNFYLEIATDLHEAEQLFFLNFLEQISTAKDSLNSLVLDLRSISKLQPDWLGDLSSFVKKLVDVLEGNPEPLFNLTLRLNEKIFAQIDPAHFKNVFTNISSETEVTLELIKYIDHQSDDSAMKILETLQYLKKDSLRKFEIDVFYVPLYKDKDLLVPADIMLQTLQLSSLQGVNTLVRYINPESSVSLLEQIDYWRDFFSQKLNEQFMFNALIPSFESRKSSDQRCFLMIKGQTINFQYCIYNRFGLEKQARRSIKKLERSQIIKELERSQKEQLSYASQTKECSECQHLNRCVEGETLSFMKERGLTECQYPESLVVALSK